MQPPSNAHEIEMKDIKVKHGAFAEVARRMGVTRVTVREGFIRRSPKYVEAVLSYLEEQQREREREIEEIAARVVATEEMFLILS